MAKVVTQQQAALTPEQYNKAVEEMMTRLAQPRDGRGLVARLHDAAVDGLADSGKTLARYGAAASVAYDKAGDAYQLEIERQQRRRARELVDHALSNGA